MEMEEVVEREREVRGRSGPAGVLVLTVLLFRWLGLLEEIGDWATSADAMTGLSMSFSLSSPSCHCKCKMTDFVAHYTRIFDILRTVRMSEAYRHLSTFRRKPPSGTTSGTTQNPQLRATY
jgi:hypothetical protein